MAPPKPKKSNMKYYVAGGLLFFGVVCAEDMYNYPDGLLSQSELFPYIVDCLNSLTDSFNDALQPTSDELLPEWPTAPCYAGVGLFVSRRTDSVPAINIIFMSTYVSPVYVSQCIGLTLASLSERHVCSAEYPSGYPRPPAAGGGCGADPDCH
jgi:hypothetical protein